MNWRAWLLVLCLAVPLPAAAMSCLQGPKDFKSLAPKAQGIAHVVVLRELERDKDGIDVHRVLVVVKAATAGAAPGEEMVLRHSFWGGPLNDLKPNSEWMLAFWQVKDDFLPRDAAGHRIHASRPGCTRFDWPVINGRVEGETVEEVMLRYRRVEGEK